MRADVSVQYCESMGNDGVVDECSSSSIPSLSLSSSRREEEPPKEFRLSEEQVREFVREGVLVVDDVLSQQELEAARVGLDDTLRRHGIEPSNLAETGRALRKLSSTNGSGGVLDVFFEPWKLQVATNPALFAVTTQLWEAAFLCRDDAAQERDAVPEDERFRWHPYGAFDCQTGYCYIDRIGYRIPTKLAEQLGAEVETEQPQSGKKIKTRRPRQALQRSLTPHLDCCPDNMYENKTKWRPIQCFVSLTDNLLPKTGGFEAVRGGFHRNFDTWAKYRPPTVFASKKGNGIDATTITTSISAPCVGEYTHIRPKEDRNVMQRIQHVPVKAGAAVFWDNRVPHANAYRHDGVVPRSVVYCSFLPDIALNRMYVRRQLANWMEGRQPADPWIRPEKNRVDEIAAAKCGDGRDHEACDLRFLGSGMSSLNQLQRNLLGIVPWEN